MTKPTDKSRDAGIYRGLKPPSVFEEETAAPASVKVPPHLDPAHPDAVPAGAEPEPVPMPPVFSEGANSPEQLAPRRPGPRDLVLRLRTPLDTADGPLDELRLRPVTLGDVADWEDAPPSAIEVLAALSGRTVAEVRGLEFPAAAEILAHLGAHVPRGVLGQ